MATFSSTSFNFIVASSNYSVDSFKAFLLGSISYMTSQYLTILITQLHTPLAAGDLDSIISGLKVSRQINKLFTDYTFEAGTRLASTISLKLFNLSTN